MARSNRDLAGNDMSPDHMSLHMNPHESEGPEHPRDPAAFRTTLWSVILMAGHEGPARADQALETLCRTYWFPLYTFVRRRGYPPHEAQDLTQEFFYHLLHKRFLDHIDRRKGRFRSFLLASLNNFLANEWDRSQRQKRGGGAVCLSLDDAAAEEKYLLEPADELTPDKAFERRWAQAVLDRVIDRMRDEATATGNLARFESLSAFVLNDPAVESYSQVASQLGLSVSAITSAIHRMRARFRQLFRQEIANTVASVEEVDDEIRYLVIALSQT